MQPDRMTTQTRTGAEVDVGLKAHMQRIYNRMSMGVLITAITSLVVSSSPAMMQFFLGGPQMYLVIFAPLAIVWFGFNPATMPSSKLQVSFIALSVLYGISFATIFYIYQIGDISRAFFIATGMFAGLSIFGYTTKKNLDGLRSFVVMGIIGILIMGILNMFFFKSAAIMDLISVVGIIAFSGMTAWQTQAMKEMYHAGYGDEANSRMAWAAALNLYISFIALFQYILQLMGNRS